MNNARRFGSTLLSPCVVLARIGKKATIQAQSSSAAIGLLTQMMISGAIATTGVTCRITAKGNNTRSNARDSALAIASRPPPSAAAASAARVILRVKTSDAPSRL